MWSQRLAGHARYVGHGLASDPLYVHAQLYTHCMCMQASEHADHEYTQIIVLVALLRQHFQHKQEKHTHRGILPPKPPSSRPTSSAMTSLDTRLTVPALTRAKMAITNSFENLRSKSATEKRRKSSQSGEEATEQEGSKVQEDQQDLKTESLNVRSLSPLFARKTNIDTLMAPVSTSPLQDGIDRGRNRSYTAGAGEMLKGLPVPVLEKNSQKEQVKEKKGGEEKRGEGGPQGTTPHRPTLTAKRRSLSEKQNSLTPPAASTVEKYIAKGHRRSTSNIVSSRTWRQEIFDSVYTPSKLERRTDSDICKLPTVGARQC